MSASEAKFESAPVVIVGAGPVGLTLAALLAKQGIKAIIVEADAGYCTGSRAICVSRRSQEILSWAGAGAAMAAKGLAWTGGRSYWRDQEVLHFEMPHEPTERFAPMLNIQQFYVEEFTHRAALASSCPPDLRWSTRVVAVDNLPDGPLVTLESTTGSLTTIKTEYLIACDGGRSTVREQLGLQLEGIQYDGKYVIVDIEQQTQRPVERLAWFDPPSNPGSTLLMHRQPDDVWRIDYQLRDDEDPIEAVKPENVLPRVKSHLEHIGETAPWKPLWISIYNAKCLTLPCYQFGRTFFAGDAAHLVPIFGVRGLNSGVDDAANLAWKLSMVLQRQASPSLLESYTVERLFATQENIRYGAKSTEFMAPPSYGFILMREAALRLASAGHRAKSLINPRQSTPIEYVGSPLNQSNTETVLKAGLPAPDAKLVHCKNGAAVFLSELFGSEFVLLVFSDSALTQKPAEFNGLAIQITGKSQPPLSTTDWLVLYDAKTKALAKYSARAGNTFLIRPDAYVVAGWPSYDPNQIIKLLTAKLTQATEIDG
jgi:3-(3-hydroxy-phenyl)propionate hydroxylase